MAGSAEPPEEAVLSPMAPTTITIREVVDADMPSKKICHGLGSTSLDSSERHVWADLTDSLLHLIIVLFRSFHDFLAVTGTCRSWRAAVSSFPPLYHFPFPPLHLKVSVRYAHRHIGDLYYSTNPLSNFKWQFRDPAKTNLSLCRSAPRNTPYYVQYLGCSYGYLIFCCGEQCLLVDVYTSTMMKPPKFPRRKYCPIHYGILMAPLSSPNSGLLLFSRNSIIQWQVGADTWTEHPLVAQHIHQIVSFKGEMFAMECLEKLSTISLAPQIGMREVPVACGEAMVAGLRKRPWLVVCGDKLLMVDISVAIHQTRSPRGKFCFHVFHLDLSAKPPKYVKLKRLENWALFVSSNRRSPTFSCMSPERWGGKSNYVYVPSKSEDSDEPWVAVELGQSMCSRTHPLAYILASKDEHLDSMWVLPSLVYGVRQ